MSLMAIYHTIGRSGSLGELAGILYEVLMSGQSAFKAVLISSGLRDAHVSLESRGADRGLHPTPPLFLCFGLLIICSVTLHLKSALSCTLIYCGLIREDKDSQQCPQVQTN